MKPRFFDPWFHAVLISSFLLIIPESLLITQSLSVASEYPLYTKETLWLTMP